jgi:pyridoxine/pyridoxamine 5'-phosphate oxidase
MDHQQRGGQHRRDLAADPLEQFRLWFETAGSLAHLVFRPFGSRLGARASQQSAVISSLRILAMQWEHLQRRFADGEVPLPVGRDGGLADRTARSLSGR